jgi:hypothetical protein
MSIMKFNNRRVIVEDLPENNIGLMFKIMIGKDDPIEPENLVTIKKNKVRVTVLRISEEAAIALYFALEQQLENRRQGLHQNPPKYY